MLERPDWMPRVFYPAFRGIIIRGIERRKIFRDNKDRDSLVERLEHLIPATNTPCYAWAFLPNQAHFLFRSGDGGLSTLIRRSVDVKRVVTLSDIFLGCLF